MASAVFYSAAIAVSPDLLYHNFLRKQAMQKDYAKFINWNLIGTSGFLGITPEYPTHPTVLGLGLGLGLRLGLG